MDLLDRYYTVLDTLPDHIFVFSESGVYIDVYGGEENATGFDCKPFIGKRLHDVAPQALADLFLSYIHAALRTNKTQTVKYKFDEEDSLDLPEHVIKPRDIWFEGIIKPLPISFYNENVVLWIAKNITTQHHLELRLKYLSEIDALTGVLNRRAFTQTLEKSIHHYQVSHQSFALIMYDIDRFKRVNDTLGHMVGDEVIKHVVACSQRVLPPSAVLGRIGGEEFAIMVNGLTLETTQQLAERLRVELERHPCDTEKYSISVTVSVGIAEISPQDQNTLAIISRADSAMYHAKNNGRNQVMLYKTPFEASETTHQGESWFRVK
jgi:two-component system, cell cycle response regulator